MGGSMGSSWPNGLNFFQFATEDDGLIARQPVTVSADVSGIVVDLKPTVTVRGRFVVPANAPPAPFGPIVQAQPADGSASLSMLSSARLGQPATPTFTVNGLLPGRYILRTLGPYGLKSITWNGKDYTNTPIDTTSGQDFDDVVVTFTIDKQQLSGTVSTAPGLPAPTMVVAFPAERELWSDYGLTPFRILTAPVSTSNAYSFTSIPGGNYLLFALDAAHADAWKDPAFLASVAGLATPVSLEWGEKKTQDIQTRPIR
jgi:hypothetical protein